ncbi:MAG: AtpZ/AtpI family protein [Bacteroidetes bacterium]|nr:AtpZ/AtpI family protein [Bacteroidota bacterium]
MKLKPDKLKNVNKIYREVGPYLGLGMQLAITVTVMVFLGVWLDEKFDLSPLLTIVFAMLGVFAGMYNFIKSVMNSGK